MQSTRKNNAAGLLSIAWLGMCLALMGCIGYVQGPGPEGGVIVTEPDFFIFGGPFHGGYGRGYGGYHGGRGGYRR